MCFCHCARQRVCGARLPRVPPPLPKQRQRHAKAIRLRLYTAPLLQPVFCWDGTLSVLSAQIVASLMSRLQKTAVFIVGAKRTAFGAFGGKLKDFSCTDLAVEASKAALADGKIDPATVDSVFVGNVSQTNADTPYMYRTATPLPPFLHRISNSLPQRASRGSAQRRASARSRTHRQPSLRQRLPVCRQRGSRHPPW